MRTIQILPKKLRNTDENEDQETKNHHYTGENNLMECPFFGGGGGLYFLLNPFVENI